MHAPASPNACSPGADSKMYLIDDKCYAVGRGVFSPFGTFALLAATFVAALSIDWVRPQLPLSVCFSARFMESRALG